MGSLAGGAEKLVENAVVVAGRVEEMANKVVGAVANAVAALLDGSNSSGGGPDPAEAPAVPPAVPAPAAPVPAGGSSSPSGASYSGGSGHHSGHDYDLPLEELAVLVLSSIALLQGGKIRSFSSGLLRPASALRPALERPG